MSIHSPYRMIMLREFEASICPFSEHRFLRACRRWQRLISSERECPHPSFELLTLRARLVAVGLVMPCPPLGEPESLRHRASARERAQPQFLARESLFAFTRLH